MIVDLFAGPGGWSEALRHLDLTDIGLEWDQAACQTRQAAGHLTVRADVATYPPERFVGADGLIASPPCPDFSMAGKRAGIDGESGRLMWEVPRWVEAVRPSWVACEQVPPALEWFELFAARFREWGYLTWCGVLNAADFGVPQTRRRAFLLASRDRLPVPPAASHARSPMPVLFGEPLVRWVSMADALGWGDTPDVNTRGERKTAGGNEFSSSSSWAVTSKAGSWKVVTGGVTTDQYDARSVTEPAPPITAANNTYFGPESAFTEKDCAQATKLTTRDALILQSFQPDYPVAGTKTKQFEQIGNAVPPLLAQRVLEQVAV